MKNISVIALGVSDVSKSVAFYRDIVGLAVQNQFEQIAFLSGGSVTLMLNGGLRRIDARDGPLAGATELVFGVESVTAEHQRLSKLGCNFVSQPREVTPGSWAVVFTDPDGHYLSAFGPR